MKTWFIAGASKGLGRAWAQAALARGDRVAAGVRDPGSIADLQAAHGEAVVPLRLDVTDRQDVFAAVEQAAQVLGRLDVVVANAGYGLFGAVEETTEAQARAVFDTNFFGALNVVQAALPRLRAQGGGHLLVTSSLAGIITFPTAGLYNASKWALEGLVETLFQEVSSLGVKITLVEPAGYDTDWRSQSAVQTDPDPAYAPLREVLRLASVNRKLGKPEATGPAILKLVDAENPPLRLFLGEAALPAARKIYDARVAAWEAWDQVARAAQG